MRTNVIADDINTNWVKNAMSVSSLSLTQRTRRDLTSREPTSPQERKSPCTCKLDTELLVEIPREFIPPQSSKHFSDNNTYVRTESVTPQLSERSPRPTLTLNLSPRSVCSWTEMDGSFENRSPTPQMTTPNIIMENTASVGNGSSQGNDVDKPEENVMKISVSVKPQRNQEIKNGKECKSFRTKHILDTSVSSVCTLPKMRKDVMGKKNKGIVTLDSLFKPGTEQFDGKVSVRQQFYDKWARAKRGRTFLQSDSTRRKFISEELCKNANKNRKTRFLKTANDKRKDMTLEVPEIDEIYDYDSSHLPDDDDIVNSDSYDAHQQHDMFPGHCVDETERYSTAEDRRETITAIINDIKDSLKSLGCAGKSRRSISQPVSEPYNNSFDDSRKSVLYSVRKNLQVPAVNAEYEASSHSEDINGRTLFEHNETFPWNRYHSFRFPVKLDTRAKRSANKISRNDVGKENQQTMKIPMILSKRTPIFTVHDKISVDFPSRRVEEHFFKIKNKTNINQLSVNCKDRICRSANCTNSKTPRENTPNSLNMCGKQEQTPSMLSPLVIKSDRAYDQGEASFSNSTKRTSVKYKISSDCVQRLPRQEWALPTRDKRSALVMKGESAVNMTSSHRQDQ